MFLGIGLEIVLKVWNQYYEINYPLPQFKNIGAHWSAINARMQVMWVNYHVFETRHSLDIPLCVCFYFTKKHPTPNRRLFAVLLSSVPHPPKTNKTKR